MQWHNETTRVSTTTQGTFAFKFAHVAAIRTFVLKAAQLTHAMSDYLPIARWCSIWRSNWNQKATSKRCNSRTWPQSTLCMEATWCRDRGQEASSKTLVPKSGPLKCPCVVAIRACLKVMTAWPKQAVDIYRSHKFSCAGKCEASRALSFGWSNKQCILGIAVLISSLAKRRQS